MGLFSFLKKAGAALADSRKTQRPEKAGLTNEQKGILLRGMLENHDLTVENLSLTVNDDHVTVFGQVASQEIREKVILTLGNVAGIATVEDNLTVVDPKPEATFYEVQRGDTLWKISKQHYGNGSKYPVIFEANRPMLKDPDKIYPGQVLRIPPLD